MYLKSQENGEVVDTAVDAPRAWKRATPSGPEDSLTVLASGAPYADTVLDFRSCSKLAKEISEFAGARRRGCQIL